MADKKRNKNIKTYSNKKIYSQPPETFDDSLEDIRKETLAAVVENETFPRGRNSDGNDEDVHIYYAARDRYKKTGRYEQSPDTVAQHMEDRTQFRH